MPGIAKPKDAADLLAEVRTSGRIHPALVAAVHDALRQLERVPERNNWRPDLTPDQVRVLALRYGLDGETGRTLEQTGQALGVTRERVRQLEALAIRKLRRLAIAETTPRWTGETRQA